MVIYNKNLKKVLTEHSRFLTKTNSVCHFQLVARLYYIEVRQMLRLAFADSRSKRGRFVVCICINCVFSVT